MEEALALEGRNFHLKYISFSLQNQVNLVSDDRYMQPAPKKPYFASNLTSLGLVCDC
jgi:hypothetical protein